MRQLHNIIIINCPTSWGGYTVIEKYAKKVHKFTNILEQELKGLKSPYFSVSMTLPWEIDGDDGDDSGKKPNFEKK